VYLGFSSGIFCAIASFSKRKGIIFTNVNITLKTISFWKIYANVTPLHGSRKDFSQGGQLGDFSKFFPGGIKSGEICFSPSPLKKQPFF